MNYIDMNNKVARMIRSWFESGGSIDKSVIDRYAALLLKKLRQEGANVAYIYNLREIVLPYHSLFPLFVGECYKLKVKS